NHGLYRFSFSTEISNPPPRDLPIGEPIPSPFELLPTAGKACRSEAVAGDSSHALPPAGSPTRKPVFVPPPTASKEHPHLVREAEDIFSEHPRPEARKHLQGPPCLRLDE